MLVLLLSSLKNARENIIFRKSVWQTLAERHMTPTCRHMTPTCRHMTPTCRHLTPTLSKKNWIFIEILIGKIHRYCVDLRPFVRFPKYLFYPKLFQYYISLLKGGCQVTAGGCQVTTGGCQVTLSQGLPY